MSMSNEVSETATEKTTLRFNLRGFFSLLLFASFTLLALSGIVLYAAPRCRIADLTGWAVLGLTKEQWSAVHIVLPLIVLVATGFHLYYNWNVFWGYIKRKAQGTLNLKLEMGLALLLCVMTVFGAVYGIPPFGTIIQWNEDIKEYWHVRAADPSMEYPDAHDLRRGGGGGRGLGGGARDGTGHRE